LKIRALVIFLAFLLATNLFAQDSVKIAHPHRRLTNGLIAPVLLVGSGLAVNDKHFFITRTEIENDRNSDFPHFHTTADNYLQYAPAVAVYGLMLAGVRGKNTLANQTALLIKTEILMTAIVTPLKYSTHELRPDGSNHQSFPSGHTAQAFAAATFLHREYGHVSIWYSIGGYTVATAVGALRILNDKHWLSDVMVGAGIGILSANMVYLTHRYRWGNKGDRERHALIFPTYGRGPGIYYCYRFP
jgi:membrane-associated phospholipid phosphatase